MKEAKEVLLESVSFNAANVASKEKDAFIKEMMAGSNYSDYTDADRKKLFEKAYSLCMDAVPAKAVK